MALPGTHIQDWKFEFKLEASRMNTENERNRAPRRRHREPKSPAPFKFTLTTCTNLERGSSSFRQTTLHTLQHSIQKVKTPTLLTHAIEAIMICLRDTDHHVVGSSLSCLATLLRVQLTPMSHHSSASLLNTLLPPHRRREIVARLGHSKPLVRNSCLDLLVYASTVSREFQAALFVAHCNDKNWLVRLNILQLLTETLARQIYAADATVVELCTPILTVLMDDRRSEVRDAAVDALVVLNQCDTEGLLLSTLRAQPGLRRSALQHLFNRFNEAAGGDNSSSTTTDTQENDPDHKNNTNTKNRVLQQVDQPHQQPQQQQPQQRRRRRPRQTPNQKRKTTVQKKKSSFGLGSPTGEEPFALPMECQVVQCPTNVQTFHQELDLVESNLSSLSADWNDRIRSMIQVQGLLLGNCFAVHSYQGNEVAWKSIVDGLVIQLSDLRSKVVRQACATVSTLAASLGSDFHSYVEMIVPPLILLTGVAKKVMSSSADLCIKYIIGSHQYGYSKMLKLLIAATAKKGNRDATRMCSQQYLCLSLAAWPRKTCLKEHGNICEAITQSLKDPNVEVRAAARLTYWSYQVHFNKGSQKILKSLSTSETNRLHDAKPASELSSRSSSVHQQLRYDRREEGNNVARSDGASSMHVHPHQQFNNRNNNNDDDDDDNNTLAKGGLQHPSPGHFHSRREIHPVHPVHATPNQQHTPATSSETTFMGTSTIRRMKAPPPAPVTALPPSAASVSSSTATSKFRGATRPNRRPPTTGGADLATNRSNFHKFGSTPAFENTQEANNNGTRSTNTPEQRVVVLDKAKKTSYLQRYAQQQQDKKAGIEDKEKQPQETEQAVVHTTTAQVQLHHHRSPIPTTITTATTVVEIMEQLRGTNAADWKTRLRCYNQLSVWLNENQPRLSLNNPTSTTSHHSPPSSSASSSTITSGMYLKYETLMKMITSSIPDAHHKVTTAALIVLQHVLTLTPTAAAAAAAAEASSTTTSTNGNASDNIFGAANPTHVYNNVFTSGLPQILAHVFQTLVDARSGLRKESNVILSLLLDRFETNDLVSILVTLIDHSSSKTRLGCLEFFLHLIPMAGHILSHTSVMRQAVHKTCENMKSTNISVRNASENVLISLHTLNTNLMLTHLNTVHSHLRESIIHQLKYKIPRIKQALVSNGRLSNKKRNKDKTFIKRGERGERGETVQAPPRAPSTAASTSVLSTPSGATYHVPATKALNFDPHHPSSSATHAPTTNLKRKTSRTQKRTPRNKQTAPTIPTTTTPALLMAQHNVVDILTSLSSTSSQSSKARGLVQVSRLSTTLLHKKNEWSYVFPQLIIAVVGTLKSTESSTRVHGLMAIRTMLETHPLPFNGLTDIVLRSILDACHDDVQDVLSSASTTLQLMARTLNCTCCAKSLLSIMASLKENQNTSVMKMCLRTMGMFVPKMSSATVYGALDDIMPPVLKCINSTESSIRKESVFLFVQIYSSVGDVHARPYMNTLTIAQQKLCTIYIRRSVEKKG